jgi:hypothetical protein
MTSGPDVRRDPLEFCSFRLTTRTEDDHDIDQATGFVVHKDGAPFLITNWHVVSGRHPQTGHEIGDAPEYLMADFHRKELMGRWRRVRLALRDHDHRPLWREHPHGGRVDVVAIALPNLDDVVVRPLLTASPEPQPYITTADPVHVIGFPLGVGVGGHWPLWLTGHIASDPAFDFDGRPAFLVDVRARGGMSGSPVVVTTSRSYVPFGDGYGVRFDTAGPKVGFVGIYSSRADARLDIGCVWRPHVLDEILTGVVNENRTVGRFNAQQPDDFAALIDEDGAPIIG